MDSQFREAIQSKTKDLYRRFEAVIIGLPSSCSIDWMSEWFHGCLDGWLAVGGVRMAGWFDGPQILKAAWQREQISDAFYIHAELNRRMGTWTFSGCFSGSMVQFQSSPVQRQSVYARHALHVQENYLL